MNDAQHEDEDELLPANEQKTLEWIAVLSAAGLDYRLAQADTGWAIYVPRSQSAAARSEIAAYEDESRNWPPRRVRANLPWLPPHETLAALWIVGALLIAFAWLGPYNPHDPLARAGSADAEAIMRGQWWRAVTALTLHSGLDHLVGNLLSLAVLGHAVCRLFGGGMGGALILGSGIAGNLTVAWLVQTHHISVGASTSSFGAIGILVTCQSIRMFRGWRDWRSIWSRVWIPLGAGISLLTLLGSGPDSDVGAHLFGFLFGLLFALPVSLTGVRRLGAWGQRLLAFVCLSLLLSAWTLAQRHAG